MLERLKELDTKFKEVETIIIMLDEYENLVGRIEDQFYGDIVKYFDDGNVEVSPDGKIINIDIECGVENHENTSRIFDLVKQNNIYDWDIVTLYQMAKDIHSDIINELLD